MLFMLIYMVLLLKSGDKSPFTHNTKELAANRSRRKWVFLMFFGSMPPMIYFSLSYRVHRVVGAYTSYAFFEWALIVFDVMFDSLAKVEFKALDLAVLPGKPGEQRE